MFHFLKVFPPFFRGEVVVNHVFISQINWLFKKQFQLKKTLLESPIIPKIINAVHKHFLNQLRTSATSITPRSFRESVATASNHQSPVASFSGCFDHPCSSYFPCQRDFSSFQLLILHVVWPERSQTKHFFIHNCFKQTEL